MQTNMRNFFRALSLSHGSCKPPWKILFFGTDRFAVHSLKALHENQRFVRTFCDTCENTHFSVAGKKHS